MKFTISKIKLFMILFLIPFFEPDSLSFFDSMNKIQLLLSIARVLISSYMIYKYLFYKRYFKIPVKMFALYELSIILVNIFNGTIYFGFIISCFNSVGFFILNNYLFDKNRLEYFKSYRKFTGVYLIINFILQVIYPNGIVSDRIGDSRIWFLGTKNGVTTFAIIYILCYFSSNLIEFKKIRLVDVIKLLIMLCIIMYGRSMTLILGVILFLIMLCILNILKISKRSFKIFSFIVIAIILIIMLTDLKDSIMLFITKIAGKDITFSGRIAIWEQALQYFKESPIVGKGVGLEFIPWSNGVIVYSAHNVYLEMLSKFGVIVATLYFFMLIKNWLKLIRNKSRMNNIAIAFITVFIIISVFEAYNDFIRAFVIAYSSFIINEKGEFNEKDL